MHDISKAYTLGGHEHFVLRGIDFSVEQSELVAIMGASGSGKSTLMNIIGLLDRASGGSYKLDGHEVSELSTDALSDIRNKNLGFVFQSFFLLPRQTILQNVALPFQYVRHRELPDIKERCLHLLEKVGMIDHAHKKPYQLSGGQQQRVAIARALVLNPTVILADEPTGALDSKIGQEVLDLFISLNENDKTTIVIVTHDAKVAAQCHRTVRVQDGKVANPSNSAATTDGKEK